LHNPERSDQNYLSFYGVVHNTLPKWAAKFIFSVDICDINSPRCIYSLVVAHGFKKDNVMNFNPSRLIGPTITIVVIGLWIFGTAHGLKKHDNFRPIEDFYTSWYYGIEFFWHKTDYKQLNDEVATASYLVMSKSEDAKEQQDHNETKRKFKKGLKRYTDKEIDYIKSGVSTFMKFAHSWQNDFVAAISRYNYTKEFKIIKTDSTVNLEKQCLTYDLQDPIDGFNKMSNQYSSLLKVSVEKAMQDPLLKELFNEQKIKDNLIRERLKQKEIFETLFDK
jgi:hypothetical protein